MTTLRRALLVLLVAPLVLVTGASAPAATSRAAATLGLSIENPKLVVGSGRARIRPHWSMTADEERRYGQSADLCLAAHTDVGTVSGFSGGSGAPSWADPRDGSWFMICYLPHAWDSLKPSDPQQD